MCRRHHASIRGVVSLAVPFFDALVGFVRGRPDDQNQTEQLTQEQGLCVIVIACLSAGTRTGTRRPETALDCGTRGIGPVSKTVVGSAGSSRVGAFEDLAAPPPWRHAAVEALLDPARLQHRAPRGGVVFRACVGSHREISGTVDHCLDSNTLRGYV